MTKDVFAFERLRQTIAGWMADDFNRELFFDEPRAAVEAAIKVSPQKLSPAEVDRLSHWCLMDSINSCETDLESACNQLHNSVAWRIPEFELRRTVIEKGGREQARQSSVMGLMPDAAMSLARAILADMKSEAQILAKEITRGLGDELFGGRKYALPVTQFVLETFDRWTPAKRRPSAGLEKDHCYSRLITAYDSGDEKALNLAFIEACDLHIERSRESTSKFTYEFDSDAYRVYPAELFAFLKLCSVNGVKLKAEIHPITNTPLAALGPPRTLSTDPLIGKLTRVLRK